MTLHESNAYQVFEVPPPSYRWPIFWAVITAIWLLVILWLKFPPPAEWVELVYSRGFFRLVAMVLVPVTSLVPGSIALTAVIGLSLTFFISWIFQWIRIRRQQQGSHWRGLLWGFQWLYAGGAVLAAVFIVFWGAGYQRPPAMERLGLPVGELDAHDADQIRALCLEIIRTYAPTEPEGARDRDGAIAAIAVAMADVIREWDGSTPRLPKGVKATPPGLLLANGTSGICAPFTLEPHVDGALPDTAFVYVAAHELGHVAGMCREDEATLAGFAAGIQADHPFARYAVALDVYTDLVRTLRGDERQQAIDALPAVAKEDLARIREISQQYRIDWFGRISWRVYDSYLQSQGIAEGRANYGKGVLLFAKAVQSGLVPLEGFEPRALEDEALETLETETEGQAETATEPEEDPVEDDPAAENDLDSDDRDEDEDGDEAVVESDTES